MNILTKPLHSLRRAPASASSLLPEADDDLLPLEPPNICLTGKPEFVLELLAALPENLSPAQQRRVVASILEHKAKMDPDSLLGEVVWKKREALAALQRLSDEQDAEQAAITAQIEALWNQREAVQERFAHQGEALRKQVEQMDRLMAFLGEEAPARPVKPEPHPFLRLAA